MKKIHQLLFLLLLFLFQTADVQAQDILPENFEQWILDGMEQWDIPGMAIAVVKDNEIILAEGYGIRNLDDPQPVNADTQFGVASISKHMTASALAILVDKELIDWHDPVTKYIPWFKLSDPWATANVTIHDLLTHQVGVGRLLGNRLQFMNNSSREEMLYQMRYHEFEEPFRSAYVYSNVMYTLAGEIVPAVTGQSWDEFMAEQFFGPMEMSRTNTSVDDLHEDGNMAWPHQYIEGEIVTIPLRNWDVSSPAGGVNSTATDMAKWMIKQLNNGRYNNLQLISEQSLTEIQTPKIAREASSVDAPQNSYGYGYNITDYRGFRLLSHGGATDGMNTTYMLVPEIGLGIIVMTNVFTTFREAIARTLIDHNLNSVDRDWNDIYFNAYTNRYNIARQQREEFESTRIPDTTPTHSMEEYTGLYHNKLYQNADIRLENDKLILTIFDDEKLTGELEHWHHNTFRIHWNNPGMREEFLSFDMNLNGEIDQLNIRFTLRPMLIQAGAYPTDYYRDVIYQRTQ